MLAVGVWRVSSVTGTVYTRGMTVDRRVISWWIVVRRGYWEMSGCVVVGLVVLI